MFRLAVLVWMMLATALAGVGLLVVLTVPSLADQVRELLPIVCGAAVVAAVPLSYLVAWRISRVAVG
jgi:hypothetical protein